MRQPHPFAENLRRQRAAAKEAADFFVLACQSGNAEALREGASAIYETVGGWTAAIRATVRRLQSVSPDIQRAFLQIWIETKMLPLEVGDDRALFDAARVLLPSYRGVAVRLFRGATAGERRKRVYGLCWTADIAVAERFAEERRQWDGGSVVLETLAPAKAIICAVDYPKPLTVEELARDFPNMPPRALQAALRSSQNYDDEREYIVDRRYLDAVTVARRYAQIEIEQVTAI